MDKFKDIEKIFNASQRKGPVLELQEKQALWQEIQRRNHLPAMPAARRWQAGEGTKISEEHEGFWKQWKVWTFGLAAIAACLVLVFILQKDEDETIKQLAYTPSTHNLSLDDMISERGGGIGEDTTLWKFNAPEFSTEKPEPTAIININQKISEEKINTIADLFQLDKNGFQQKMNNIPNDFVNKYNTYLCLPYRYALFTEEPHFDVMEIDRCVSITQEGSFSLEQKPEIGEPDGLAEAKKYIAAITGYDIDDLFAVEQKMEQPFQNKKNFKEYNIFYTDKSISPMSWHIALDNDKLSSLTGRVIEQSNDQGQKIEIISEQEAYDRLIVSFKEEQLTLPIQLDGTLLVPSNIDVEDKNIIIDISEISLEYNLATTSDPNDNSRTIYVLIPVYRVFGIERNSQAKFEVFIDPSIDQTLFRDYNTYNLNL
jgi:hypothetical protein